MRTLYIDVYFLINFTVDILALYFAASFSKTPTSVPRLLIAALVGAMYAVAAIIFFDESKTVYLFSFALLVLSVTIASGRVRFYRKVKYGIAYILFQIILGGLVYYGYCLLDRLMDSVNIEALGGENKNLLILSLIVLLSIGVLKLVMAVFGNTRSEKSVRLLIKYNGAETCFEALVDSGNLAVDPLDATPVMLVTYKEWERIFGSDADIENIDEAVYRLRRRFRIIPVSFGNNKKILYGIKTDSVYVITAKGQENISVVIATDKEEESYGGYSALIPLSALDGVL